MEGGDDIILAGEQADKGRAVCRASFVEPPFDEVDWGELVGVRQLRRVDAAADDLLLRLRRLLLWLILLLLRLLLLLLRLPSELLLSGTLSTRRSIVVSDGSLGSYINGS